MRVLRSPSIGSISAWLPSRRSTEHQIGGSVITADGHRRSGRSTGLNGTYFSVASTVCLAMGASSSIAPDRSGGNSHGGPAHERPQKGRERTEHGRKAG